MGIAPLEFQEQVRPSLILFQDKRHGQFANQPKRDYCIQYLLAVDPMIDFILCAATIFPGKNLPFRILPSVIIYVKHPAGQMPFFRYLCLNRICRDFGENCAAFFPLSPAYPIPRFSVRFTFL